MKLEVWDWMSIIGGTGTGTAFPYLTTAYTAVSVTGSSAVAKRPRDASCLSVVQNLD